ncbi:hypothetical protein KIPB_001367 [Kipferlia bialata]|uniref:Protein kinase domain-containing protein n=1 Tax=Kipferlia bialata TaxID=797122 RepID=A0A9K3CNU2_9EUKA|nr:hypothetical protein KIPB_001367 [Kipferlia bialata]|eukprot:g1367.t1
MQTYKILEQIGDGAYGLVLKGIHRKDGHKVAIKRMKAKMPNWEECVQLSEVKSLMALKAHPNVIRLLEVVRDHDILNLVFEYIGGGDLYQLEMAKKRSGGFSVDEIRSLSWQILQALSYTHKNGFFHRDIKPENMLIAEGGVLKLGDFGLARQIRSQPPYTEYVSTRWYRAPEVLLRARDYNSPVDVWAVGCLIAELVLLRPLFPGKSEVDQLVQICASLGPPFETWQDGARLATRMQFRFPSVVCVPLSHTLSGCDPECLSLIQSMLRWDPQKRPSAQAALRHPFFIPMAQHKHAQLHGPGYNQLPSHQPPLPPSLNGRESKATRDREREGSRPGGSVSRGYEWDRDGDHTSQSQDKDSEVSLSAARAALARARGGGGEQYSGPDSEPGPICRSGSSSRPASQTQQRQGRPGSGQDYRAKAEEGLGLGRGDYEYEYGQRHMAGKAPSSRGHQYMGGMGDMAEEYGVGGVGGYSDPLDRDHAPGAVGTHTHGVGRGSGLGSVQYGQGSRGSRGAVSLSADLGSMDFDDNQLLDSLYDGDLGF